MLNVREAIIRLVSEGNNKGQRTSHHSTFTNAGSFYRRYDRINPVSYTVRNACSLLVLVLFEGMDQCPHFCKAGRV